MTRLFFRISLLYFVWNIASIQADENREHNDVLLILFKPLLFQNSLKTGLYISIYGLIWFAKIVFKR